MQIDPQYLGVVCFIIGTAAGFQAVHENYAMDVIRACRTPHGVLYLMTRGGFPTLLFRIALQNKLIGGSQLWLKAAACGAGAELFLRTSFYIKRNQVGTHFTELAKGPFDLLRWYQNYFLEGIADRLARQRLDFVHECLPPEKTFLELCEIIETNLPAWPGGHRRYVHAFDDVTLVLEKDVSRLRVKFRAETCGGQSIGSKVDKKYCMKLGFLILDRVGRTGFKTLLKLTP